MSSSPPSGSVTRLFAPVIDFGELDRQTVEEIPPAPVRARLGAAPEQLRQFVVAVRKIGVAVTSGIGAAVIGGRIIAIERLLGRPLGARRVDLAGIELFAFVFIAQQVVGGRDLLELVFGGLVAGIEIRVQLLRQLAIGAANIGGGGRRGDAENFVRIPHDLPRGLHQGTCNIVRREKKRQLRGALRAVSTRAGR